MTINKYDAISQMTVLTVLVFGPESVSHERSRIKIAAKIRGPQSQQRSIPATKGPIRQLLWIDIWGGQAQQRDGSIQIVLFGTPFTKPSDVDSRKLAQKKLRLRDDPYLKKQPAISRKQHAPFGVRKGRD